MATTETPLPQVTSPAKTETASKSVSLSSRFAAMPFQMKVLIISASFFVFLLVLLLLLSFSRPPATIDSVLPSVFPSGQTSASLVPREVSQFAKTDQFVAFEEHVVAFSADNANVDLAETSLVFPFLDMNIRFQEQFQ